MDVYFIRHGQTDGNVARRHQHPETPINELGLQQTKLLKNELIQINPTHLISSTHLRALLTAREIGLMCHLTPQTEDLFREFRRPAFLVGERLLHRNTLRYIWRWFFGFKDASFHDGETYVEFIKRIKAAREYLEALPDDAVVVVVSHSVFINFFLEHMCNSRPMGFWRAALCFIRLLATKNASVTHVQYSDTHSLGVCKWRVV